MATGTHMDGGNRHTHTSNICLLDITSYICVCMYMIAYIDMYFEVYSQTHASFNMSCYSTYTNNKNRVLQ